MSALAFHELTDEIPHEVSIAIQRGATSPIIDHPPVRIFRFADFAYRLGIEHHKIEGIDLKVYSAAKTSRRSHDRAHPCAASAASQGGAATVRRGAEPRSPRDPRLDFLGRGALATDELRAAGIEFANQ